MNQLISTDASRVKLIYISWRTTENPKHSSSSCLLGSARAADWFIHCSSHLLPPSCQEWMQNCSGAHAAQRSEADRVDGSDLLSGAASVLNKQPLGAIAQESYLSCVLHGAGRWRLCVTLVWELRMQRIVICAFTFKELGSLQKNPKPSWCSGHQLKCGFTWEARRAMSHPGENHPRAHVQPQSTGTSVALACPSEHARLGLSHTSGRQVPFLQPEILSG